MGYVFPAAFMANTFAMTGVMMVLSVGGKPELAADFGIVHGATVALFLAFSANARSIILNPASGIASERLLVLRLMLVVPLGALSFLLSTQLAGVEALLALVLVLRRGAEWIAEVPVSAMELHRKSTPSARFLTVQLVLSLAVTVWLLANLPLPLLVIAVWAMSPLWITRALGEARVPHGTESNWRLLLPHIGSTTIIGIAVYVFRLVILLLVGKAMAGDFYAAFAFGGLLGSVFAQAIGPTLVLHEARTGLAQFPVSLRAILWGSFVAGLVLFGLASARPDQLLWGDKPRVFWMAVGLSLIGGVIMVAAQRMRLRLLQQHVDRDVFGPDVITNILVVGSVPFLFYLIGVEALAALYLLSAVLGWLFYTSALKAADLWVGRLQAWNKPLRAAIVLLLVAPVFVQMNGRIFQDPSYYFDSKRQLTLLPIPLSVLACYAGIMLLGGYERARLALTTLFLTFSFMILSTVLVPYENPGQEQARLFLMLQFLLPMFALVLGQLFGLEEATKPVLSTVVLFLVLWLVPAQLLATWWSGNVVLSPYLYLFSLYQHLQYVPVMIAGTYLISLYALWNDRRYRMELFSLGALMGIYVVASNSTLATGLLIAGVFGFAIHRNILGQGTTPAIVLCAVVVLSSFGYFAIMMKSSTSGLEKYKAVEIVESDAKVPQHMAERAIYWKFYAGKVLESAKHAAVGHPVLPDRTQYPSAHNYYLDFVYHFGLLALLPLLGLIGYTFLGLWQNNGAILASPPLLGLAVVVLFIILVDNFFKVGMRQPYPGILTFFLWGLLLARLETRSKESKTCSSNEKASLSRA